MTAVAARGARTSLRDLEGRSSLVFGGASGIGRAGVEALARRGARVLIADVDATRAAVVRDQLVGEGEDVEVIRASVLSDDDVERAVAEAEAQAGGLDILVNSAGAVARDGESIFERNIDMMLTGVWRAMQFGVGALQRRGGGSIISISSICGVTGSVIAPMGYSPAKHGVIGLTKDLALRHASDGIRVNAICPGHVATQMTEAKHTSDDGGERYIREQLRVPMGRWGHPDEIGAVIGFLASDESSFITGQAIVVDGGLTAR